MNKLISIGAIVAIVVGGAWYLTHQNDHHDEHMHSHEDGEHVAAHELVAKEPVRADGTFTIATSFYPLAFALERITGDLAVITNVGAGRDPHDFRPSTQDILTMQRADLVVLQGADFEPWGDEVVDQLKDASVPYLLATAELTLREAGEDTHGHGGEAEEHHDEEEHHDDEESHGHEAEDEEHHGNEAHEEDGDEHGHEDEHGHDHGAYDPHTWLDPVLMSEMVEHLTEAVTTLDPDNAATYQANATTLLAELAALHTEYETGLASCTLTETITSHDAFSYLADRYDFEIHTIAGISTQDMPSTQTLTELKEEAAEGVGAILLEENSVTAYGETLATETGLKTLAVNPIAYVIPDGEDYLTLMRGNLESFTTALNCNG